MTIRRRHLSRRKKISRPRRKRTFRKLYRKSKKIAKKTKKPRRKFVKKTKKRKISKKRVIRRAKRPTTGSSLERLFESPTKIQVMKLFFRNPEDSFLVRDVRKRLRINLSAIKKEMRKLEKIGFLKSRQISPRKQLFSINPNFNFFHELRELILRSCPVSKDKLLKSARGVGKIKLVLLSGLFINNNTARADLLIVGDNINSRRLNTFIKNLEAEAGTAINCVVMTTEEFKYRYDMYDRFVRDLLSEKNELLINRLGL